MRLSLVAAALAAAMSTAVPAHAGGEWPDGPNKLWFENLQRPDNHLEPYRKTDPKSLFCCGIADTVKTKFKVEPGDERYPDDRWHAWLKGEWVLVPPEKIVPDYAPEGQAYLFLLAGTIQVLCAAEGRLVMLRHAMLLPLALVPPMLAAADEWPDGPNKNFFRNLQRPDAWPGANEYDRSCCGPGDIVKTKFKVIPADGSHPEDAWFAWLNERWERIPPTKIVSDFAPDGQAYLFVSYVGNPTDWAAHGYHVVLCFVRPKGGL